MASSFAFRKSATASSPLLKKLINVDSVRSLGAAARSFNTHAQTTRYHEGDRSLDVERLPESGVSGRRDSFRSFFSDVFDPFSPRRSVSQLLNTMDQFMKNPFPVAMEVVPGAVSRRGWDVDNAVCIKMGMLGLHKENVKVSFEQEYGRRYASSLDLPPNSSKLDEIKAEMKNEGWKKDGKNIFRPLSPHLPIYKPQLSSTLSIFNRISGAFLSTVVLLSYLLCLKIGSICFTYGNFYQFLFYSSNLIPISLEISALALSYHLYAGVRHLLTDFKPSP